MTQLDVLHGKRIVMTYRRKDRLIFILDDYTKIVITIENEVNDAGWHKPILFIVDENGNPLGGGEA